MIDLHSHLLHGLDDGSPTLENSVAMARLAVADGITHMTCTPHASSKYTFEPALIAERMAELRAALAAETIPLSLGQGCDFHLSYDNLQDAQQHPARYTINGGEYLLVELPDFGLPRTMGETFYELRLAGMTPILTHPERNSTIQQKPEILHEWLRNGLLLQVTGDSVTGQMGKIAQKLAHQMLAKRWVHFLSTDAHDTVRRPPRLSAAREMVAKKYGAEYATRLCVENPQAVVEGRMLPEQDEPLGLYDDEDYAGGPWWRKLFGR